jgi:hypothetical protein
MRTKNVIIRRTMLPPPPQLNNRAMVAIVAVGSGAANRGRGVVPARVVRIRIALAALVLVASAMAPVGILLETQARIAMRRITLT